jgi:hypothetical protein
MTFHAAQVFALREDLRGVELSAAEARHHHAAQQAGAKLAAKGR